MRHGIWLLLLVLQGCLPRQVVVHDGLELSVVSATSGLPVVGVKVFSPSVTGSSKPRVLAVSNDEGRITLDPDTTVRLVPFLSEGQIYLDLWLCKPGFATTNLASRSGWNVDLRAPEIHRLGRVQLQPDGESQCDVEA